MIIYTSIYRNIGIVVKHKLINNDTQRKPNKKINKETQTDRIF